MRSVYNLEIKVDGSNVKLIITTLNDSVTVNIDYSHRITIDSKNNSPLRVLEGNG